MNRSSQGRSCGRGLAPALFLVLILAVTAGAGWYLLKKRKSDKK